MRSAPLRITATQTHRQACRAVSAGRRGAMADAATQAATAVLQLSPNFHATRSGGKTRRLRARGRRSVIEGRSSQPFHPSEIRRPRPLQPVVRAQAWRHLAVGVAQGLEVLGPAVHRRAVTSRPEGHADHPPAVVVLRLLRLQRAPLHSLVQRFRGAAHGGLPHPRTLRGSRPSGVQVDQAREVLRPPRLPREPIADDHELDAELVLGVSGVRGRGRVAGAAAAAPGRLLHQEGVTRPEQRQGPTG
mmetsp:Transcript_51674/g.160331  ORF Transcript_51674/g.160331 Transcript_51674/m.160331 type:complete len:246 (+) Transcript_51674:110-847(+)